MGKFIIRQTETGIKFDLKNDAGDVIATSQVYKSLSACKRGAESVQKNALAEIEDQTVEDFAVLTHPKYEVYKDAKGDYRFRLKAPNGQIVAISGAFKEVGSCMEQVAAVRAGAPDAQIEAPEKIVPLKKAEVE